MKKIGLTGSIGMGKSTTAKMFADEGVPVWDADAAVGRLYAKGGAGTRALGAIVPAAIGKNGVDKSKLKALIKQDSSLLSKIEEIVHPLVAKDRDEFLANNSDAELVLLDIPLLFENGTESQMDYVVVVSVDPETQKNRVLERGTMDEDTFNLIRAKQMPDAEKRHRANYVIETTTIEYARQQVQDILRGIKGR